MLGRTLSGRYTVLELLGGGGMSVVYKGRDTLLNRAVTIKVLREQFASDVDFVRRFHHEAQAVASLSHPNIINIYDVGREGDTHFLIIEYIQGETLKELIQRSRPLQLRRAVDIASQICDALQHAHDHGIVHRDVKPQNILLTPEGRVKVTDFGIAQDATSATLTRGEQVMGSVHYLSPEQARGEPSTPRSDIYALGVVLYEMLSGMLPFKGDTAISVALKHLQTEPRPLSSLAPGLPRELVRIVEKAMKKRPEERYASARDLKKDIEKFRFVMDEEDNPTRAIPSLTDRDWEAARPGRKRRRPRILAWVLLFLVLAGALAGGLSYLGRFFALPEVKVPGVLNLSLPEAERKMLEAGLAPRVNMRYNHPTAPEGVVIGQEPAENQVVKEGREVLLDLSLGAKKLVLINVTGQMEREARVNLNSVGFKVAEEPERIYNELPEGIVVKQEPLGGTKQPEGLPVRLWVSKGPEPRPVNMPLLLGLNLEDARSALESLGLKLSQVTYQRSEEYFSGQVLAQDVPPNSTVNQGTPVNLVLSSGPGPASRVYSVTNIPLPSDGKEHLVRIVVTDRKGTREEYVRYHRSGEVVEPRVTVFGQGKVSVYLDNKLIKDISI